MKDLISVFAYCPDYNRKEILHTLLLDLQELREKYDILVVAHSSISDISMSLIDYFYFESKNEIIEDFNYTNIFWFQNEKFAVNSSLVYPKSTHLAIYSLLFYTFDFAFHRGYKKIHFIEYDLKLNNINLINLVNEDLDNYDSVVFQAYDNWIMGVYFASTLQGFSTNDFKFDKQKILNKLYQTDSRMTEKVTPDLICNGRNYKKRNYDEINDGKDCQLNDEHNKNLLKWAVPLVVEETNELVFFVYNEFGSEHIIDLFIDNHYFKIDAPNVKNVWSLTPIGHLENITEIIILIDKKQTNKINFKNLDKSSFVKNNFLKYLD
jgi:hypothetical protein